MADHPGVIGQVLDQRAAERHGDNLNAAADAEYRHAALMGTSDQHELKMVKGRVKCAKVLVGAASVQKRIHINAARYKQAAGHIQIAVKSLFIFRFRNDHRQTAGGRNCLRIGFQNPCNGRFARAVLVARNGDRYLLCHETLLLIKSCAVKITV